jgi:ABC-2 type transport system ATP-binding protein
MNVIELKNISYVRSGMQHPLNNIQFVVKQGEIVHLRGVNGAGKSTLIDFILGVREPDGGEIKVFGNSPSDLKSKFLTGVVPQKLSSPIKNAQLGRLIDLIESHYPAAKGKVNSVLDSFDLELSQDKKDLAGGEERLLFFALAQAGSPKLLILDEPTTFLDSIETPDRASRQTKLWQQLQKFVDDGNTVLLVCHDKEIGVNATRTLLLQDGRLNELSANEKLPSEEVELDLIDPEGVGMSHWIQLLFKHVWFNIQQTLQADQKYIWLTFIASFLWAVCISLAAKVGSSESSSSLYTIANAYSFYLAMTAANSTGNIIAEERQSEILIRLLKILPLPPIIYLSAKVISSLVITSLLVLTMLTTTLICNVLSLSVFPALSIGLILGTIPYLFLGLALGYLFDKPKSIQIAALMCSVVLTIPIFARPVLTGVADIFKIPGKLDLAMLVGDNVAAHSPVYHYIQLILCLGKAPEYDQYFWLHLGWLIWFAFISLPVALLVYRRTSKKEAKA